MKTWLGVILCEGESAPDLGDEAVFVEVSQDAAPEAIAAAVEAIGGVIAADMSQGIVINELSDIVGVGVMSK